ncbi:hypothetical protein F5J12DRAFT_810155 [Pisolithus orientalis]|uniref:uncharacterized protein n=1 Tax=Pisolithus orientalis TaxID=936130 RepID=UPI002223F79C|nr:uncharacterized protein F5J12DRAFT_810155 [Pisolithus orientalis]KAI6025744.1 hypothetical protein F5J12DRAFT_810155 [Pisolithus orientalis]
MDYYYFYLLDLQRTRSPMTMDRNNGGERTPRSSRLSVVYGRVGCFSLTKLFGSFIYVVVPLRIPFCFLLNFFFSVITCAVVYAFIL